jgi:hypothetical protein
VGAVVSGDYVQLGNSIVPVGTLYTVTELGADTGRFETRRYIVVGADGDGAAVMIPDPDNEEGGRG